MKLARLSRLLFLAFLCFGLFGCASKQYAESSHAPSQAYAGPSNLYGGNVTAANYDGEMALEADTVSTGDSGGGRVRRFEGKEVSAKKARPDGSNEQGAQAPNSARKLIRNAWLTVEVRDEDDFKPTIERLSKMAERREGYVQSESSSGVTMLVPTDQLDDVVLEIEKMGKITQREITVVDATAQYVDMEIRISNLVKMRARLTELVNQSTSVEEVLQVERELARVTSELERLEGQLRVLSRSTTYATVNVSLKERVRPGPLGWVFYGGYKAIKWLFVWD
ncbi:MAG: DUF4349 domain-containing protein [Myxococcota bacterium]|nr:DUF4349 domain-containing protein [Myxococcota bacterium]